MHVNIPHSLLNFPYLKNLFFHMQINMSPAISLAILLIFLGSLIWSFSLQKHGRKLPPGPWALPIIGNLRVLTNLPHRSLQRLALKYGPIMSLQLGHVRIVVVSSPQAAKLFLKTHDAVFASRPKVQVAQCLSYGTKGILLTEYGPNWRSHRKLTTQHLLTTSKIESLAALRREELGSLVESLKKAGDVVNVTRLVGKLLEDMTCGMMFGRKSDDKCDLGELTQEALSLIGAPNIADFVPYLGPLDLQGLMRRSKKARKSIDKVLEKIIEEHKETANKQKGQHCTDFVDVLLSLINQPMASHNHTFDLNDTKALLIELITAAIDTTSSTIDWTLSEILKNPRVMTNVQQELESVIGMDQIVEEKDLEKLVYLDMVVKESFRLHPVGALLVPHESLKDTIIDGYHIPKKSRILFNIWAIGRDPNVWSENAEEFYPERFIGDNIDIRGHDFRLIPFGSGLRRCPGMQLALNSVRFVIAQLLHCFYWELPSGIEAKDIDMSEKYCLVVRRANHLFAKPTYRLVN